MILGLFRKKISPEPVFAVYSSIVAQSRRPRFYADWAVPDTVTGRFDMISLHLALTLRRLKSSDPAVREFGQALFDFFFKDMDRSLREMGASDIGVPKKVQKMGGLFYGLLAGVSSALDARDLDGLTAVLQRNVYGGAPAPEAAALAGYLIEEADRLAMQPIDAIVGGQLVLGEAA